MRSSPLSRKVGSTLAPRANAAVAGLKAALTPGSLRDAGRFALQRVSFETKRNQNPRPLPNPVGLRGRRAARGGVSVGPHGIATQLSRMRGYGAAAGQQPR